jgi:glycosyltransferase involved in cell wall biosynthesis
MEMTSGDDEARRRSSIVSSRGSVRLSLIIATKDRPTSLLDALESAARELPSDCEVIVVDGDPERSAESVVRALAHRHPDMDIRCVASEAGAALQRNVGIDVARGDVVVFIDDDCTVEPGLFEALTRAYGDPSVVGATGRIDGPSHERLGSNPHSRLRWLLLGGGRQGSMTSFGFRRPIVDVEQARDVQYMPGPLMSARRDLAAEVRFDERLAAYSLGEDDDFSYRLSQRGRIRYEPSAVLKHHELGWRHMDRRQMDRLQVVNRTYLFRKNFSQTLRARASFATLLAVLCAHRVVNREWSGLRGLVDGIRHVRRSGAVGVESRNKPLPSLRLVPTIDTVTVFVAGIVTSAVGHELIDLF